jgi:hypothetical protein
MKIAMAALKKIVILCFRGGVKGLGIFTFTGHRPMMRGSQ